MSTDLMEREANAGTFIPGERQPGTFEVPVADVADAPDRAEPATDSGDDIEARARAQGWRPKEEFSGPPEKWRSADEFVAKGENDLPVLRENLRRMTSKLTELETRSERDRAEYQDQLRRLEGTSSIALQRQRADLESRYSAAIRDAANAGDMDRFDTLERGKGEALRQFDTQVHEVVKPAPRQAQQGVPEHLASEVQAWKERNTWFEADPELNAVAQAHHMRLNREKPGLPLRENLAEVSRYVSQRYADKFGQPQQATAVEGGGSRMGASAPRGKGANDLPADARRAAEAGVKQGLFKDVNDYAKEYWSQ